MKKFRKYIETWIDGKNIRGINVALSDIDECIYIYNSIVKKEKPEFINRKVKDILDKCGINTITCGIGWKIA